MEARDKLGGLKRASDRFVEKQYRVNQPLQELYASEEYIKFEDDVADAIKAQGRAVIDVLKTYPESVLDSADLLGQYLTNDMPLLGEYLSTSRVEKFFLHVFEMSVRAQYKRMGLNVKLAKAADQPFDFQLTNQLYIASIKSQADYLLHKSKKIDDVTRGRMIDIIMQSRLESDTIDDLASDLEAEFDEVSSKRGFVIARTESARAAGQGNYASMKENGATTKRWVTAGPNPCTTCLDNEDEGLIQVDQAFQSGDMFEPCHPNDECYTEAGEIDLDAIDIWDGA